MKRLLCALLVCMLPLTGGCAMRELSDVGLVRGIALDGNERGGYTVTAAVMDEEGSYEYLSADGESLAGALEEMNTETFLGQNDFIVVSTSVTDAKTPLRWLARSSDGSEKVIWCDGSAGKLLQRVANEEVRPASKLPSTDLRVLSNGMESVSAAAAVPLGDESGISTMAIVVAYRMERVLTDEEVEGMRIMLGEATDMVVEQTIYDDTISARILTCDAGISAQKDQNKVAFGVDVRYRYKVKSAQGNRDWRIGRNAAILDARMDELMENRVYEAIGACQCENGDILNLAANLKKCTGQSIEKKDWVLADMDFAVTATGTREFSTAERARAN